MSAAATTRPSSRSPWPAHSQNRPSQFPSTTPLAPPTSDAVSVGQSLPPFLPPTARTPHAAQGCRTPSPNYFGFISDPASNPTDSNPGRHAKANWSPPSSKIRSTAALSPRVLPLDANPHYEAFRKHSESKTFSLGHGNLSQFSRSSPAQKPGTRLSTDSAEVMGNNEGLMLPPESPAASSNHKQAVADGAMDVDSDNSSLRSPQTSAPPAPPSFFDMPRHDSPANMAPAESTQLQRPHLSHQDERHSRLSLPGNPPSPPIRSENRAQHRAGTLPSRLQTDAPTMISPKDVVDVLTSVPDEALLLDLRVSTHYLQSRIRGALNLCIPTTLLKRPSYNVQRLAATFSIEAEKARFSRWKEYRFIIVYDASSSLLKDATSSVNTLKKFTNEGWKGNPYVIRGGFAAFASQYPDMIEHPQSDQMKSSPKDSLVVEPATAGIAQVAGGCLLPTAKTSANPFFGNIRQNMDLIGGVGQMPIKQPSALTATGGRKVPRWLRRAADIDDGGREVSDRFLAIEKAEQRRLQKALSGDVSYGTPGAGSPKSVQIAGIEKGIKNRYNNIWPYDHTRVRLQEVPTGDCDYINASHIKAAWTNKHYIATQAPMPATFEDFWRVVWEQDARVIVMLTAESEGGQLKCHPYWKSGDYGALKLKALSEKRVSLPVTRDTPKLPKSPEGVSAGGLDRRPSLTMSPATSAAGLAHASSSPLAPTKVESPTTTASSNTGSATAAAADAPPHVIIRKIALSHAGHPFAPLREITQIQYSSWPDFGVPAHPTHVLGVVEQCNAIVRSLASTSPPAAGTGERGPRARLDPADPEPPGQRPVVVHCSAGCGRTGTFCTVDSVVDMLKRQRQWRRRRQGGRQGNEKSKGEGDDVEDAMEDVVAGSGKEWVERDDVDLVAKTVEDLRDQRLSMVQSLRQFVLCYETVLEWVVRQAGEDDGDEEGGEKGR